MNMKLYSLRVLVVSLNAIRVFDHLGKNDN